MDISGLMCRKPSLTWKTNAAEGVFPWARRSTSNTYCTAFHPVTRIRIISCMYVGNFHFLLNKVVVVQQYIYIFAHCILSMDKSKHIAISFFFFFLFRAYVIFKELNSISRLYFVINQTDVKYFPCSNKTMKT